MRRIKIIYTGGPAYMARVVDAETGEPIDHIIRVQLDLDARSDGLPVAHLTVFCPELEIEVESEVIEA